jgi:hypothetical protein
MPGLVSFLLATAVALELARPFSAGLIAFDSAAAVLHFDRIAAGRHLEVFLSTTPKPLLTVLYGALFGLTHDWRVIDWATIGAQGLAVALLAGLARRFDGWRAFAFTAVALAGAPALLFDASLALATPWALLLWAVAGWAVSVERPRYWLAGVALALATLARLETLVLVGVALLVLVILRFGPPRIRRPVPRSAWLLGLGLLAIPVALVHDWLLTGNPLFWTTVSQLYSEKTSKVILTPIALTETLGRRYLAEPALAILALIGWLRLAARGRWPAAIGLAALGAGIAIFLVALAARGIFVSDRYFAAIDVAVAFAAGSGACALSVELPGALHRLRATRGTWSRWLSPAVMAVLAVAFTAGWGGIGTGLRTTIRGFAWQGVDALLARPALLAAVSAVPGARTWPAAGEPGPAHPLLLVPTPLRPQVAVDLDLPLTQVGSTNPGAVDVAAGIPAAGQVVFHDRRAEGVTTAGTEALETGVRKQIGTSVLVPLLANPGRGFWIIRIDAGG